ncbi:6-phosphogluconolactonase [Arsenicitalea aurantiaca]|uniref:6-phosphogluconolactonase n=1 Tax=Arsenicitalea aurantiaca TaxID=1783274 RepID=A0A433X3X4_9HYPH|nr:6-phosphogluconolactonase [Arsenicitalea aurantiaca]RUT28770.1 6-phosphogluconolactonase [Arsenicitalea aurantiaca]
MTLNRIDFDTRDALAKALAEAVAENLRDGIEARGRAVLAVSGGSTPAKFFARLGKTKTVDWSKVTVTLVDERWVAETEPRSNAGLVNEKMLQGPAAVAHFLPLYSGGEAPDAAAIARTNKALQEVEETFDAVVLGMGEDGHTASFFPGGDTLAAALTEPGPAIAIRAPGAGEPRVTLTLPRLLDSRALYLHIEGEAKAETLERALAEGALEDMPVRAVLRQDRLPLSLFWAP